MDTCTDVQIELERQHHGAIEELPEDAVSHVATCVACQEYRREMAEMDRVMKLELAPTLDEVRWQRIARRARWVARRPRRELACTLALIAATFAFGFVNHSTWLVSGGLVLAVLPNRIASWRKRREELRRLGPRSSELLKTVADELKTSEGRCVANALLYVALAALFVVITPFVKDLRPPLVVAALLLVMAWYDFIVRRRRVIRMQSELAP
jgi:hypothetical protein